MFYKLNELMCIPLHSGLDNIPNPEEPFDRYYEFGGGLLVNMEDVSAAIDVVTKRAKEFFGKTSVTIVWKFEDFGRYVSVVAYNRDWDKCYNGN